MEDPLLVQEIYQDWGQPIGQWLLARYLQCYVDKLGRIQSTVHIKMSEQNNIFHAAHNAHLFKNDTICIHFKIETI